MRLRPTGGTDAAQGQSTRLERVLRFLVPLKARGWAWTLVVRLELPRLTRTYLAMHPEFRSIRLTRDTSLVIDGYSRSANSYAVCAFEHANGDTFRLAHHLHSPAVFERASELGIPALLLIRRPGDAVSSMVQFEPAAALSSLIDGYIEFYRRLLPVLDRFVVAEFDDVVADFGAVVRRVNDRFGTNFVPYVKTDESEREVMAAVDGFSARHYAAGHFERRVSRPSAARADAASFLADLADRDLRALAEAHAVYESVLAVAAESRQA